MTPVLLGGCIIIMIGFAIRASFGVFQIPIAEEFGWLRAEFSLAIAIQNLAWGIGQPLFGAFARTLRRTVARSCWVRWFYAAGLVLSSFAVTPEAHQWLEVLVGFGVAGTGFGVILAVVGRAASDENRSLALGIATAAGSAGQVFGAPVAEILLGFYSWQTVFIIFAAAILLAMAALPMMRAPAPATRAELEQSMGAALKQAARDPSFYVNLSGILFLWLPTCLRHRAFSGDGDRDVRPDRPEWTAGGVWDYHHVCAGRDCDFVDRAGQYCRDDLWRHGWANAIPRNTCWRVSTWRERWSLRRSSCRRSRPGLCLLFSLVMGRFVVGHGATNIRVDRAYLRVALYGHALRHRVLQPSTGQFSGRLAGRSAVLICMAITRWCGGSVVGVGLFSAIVHLPVRERSLNLRPV